MILRRLCFAAVLCSSYMLTGCMSAGVGMEEASLRYENPGHLVEYDYTQQPLLRIAQFDDKRSPDQKVKKTPRAVNLILFAWRRGTYQIGDDIWVGGAVSKEITTAARKAFAESYFYDDVKVENSTNPTGGKGLILKGTIENFYSEQEYNAYRYFLLLFWESTEKKGEATGHAKFSYTVLDAETNLELHQGIVNFNPKESKADMTDMGIKAMNAALTQMANDVNQVLLEM